MVPWLVVIFQQFLGSFGTFGLLVVIVELGEFVDGFHVRTVDAIHCAVEGTAN